MDDERFRAVVQHSYDALVLTDATNTITYATPAVASMFGFTPEELLGRNGFTFVHPLDRRESIERARRLVGDPGGKNLFEFRLQHKDTSYRWVECTAVNLLDHPAVGAIINAFRDITDRKEADDRLRLSEERLHSLLEHADGAIVLADDHGRVTWASPGAERLWGWEPGSMAGRAMVDGVHPDDRADLVRAYRKMTSAHHLTVRVEGRMRHADGSWRWYESVFTNCLDDTAVSGVVANVRDVTDRMLADQALRETEARLEHQANYDSLTGLPNRTLLLDRLDTALARARRTGAALAVFLLDIDHFQLINDGRGHAFGDRVLQAVATRLQGVLRSGDTLARLGGDQFVVVAEDLDSTATALSMADALRYELDDPVEVAWPSPAPGDAVREEEVFVSVSVGVALADGHEAGGLSLLRDADVAISQAKAGGRHRVARFDPGMRERATERLHLETALRQAIVRHQFQVHFQPIVDLGSGQISGIEALVRWKHPQRGLLFPGTFIGVAEETGLIVPLGAWVFDSSCCQLVHLEDMLGNRLGPLSVSINLSARQLAEDSLTDDIANVLAATPIDPRQVCVEVTESAVMRDLAATSEVLHRLRVLGLRIAVDDFGTGHSSFSYLSELPVDVLKIDRSFVTPLGRNQQATDLVAGIIQLGHTLGMQVTGEGIETTTQLDTLRMLDCDRAQGHLFASALPSRKLLDLLRSGVTW